MRAKEFLSKKKEKMSVQDLLEAPPDFLNKEMPIISSSTLMFYSETTIKDLFNIIDKKQIQNQMFWVLLRKDKTMAVVGYIGNRKEDNKLGLYITGTVEFKPTLDISYTTNFDSNSAMQVDGVQVNPLVARGGQGYFLYSALVKAGYVIISDNLQYVGGRKLWNKIVTLGKNDGIIVRVVDNGTIMTDNDGNPIEYNGTNIPDDVIWADPSNDPKESKRFVVLVAKNK
jgi:hypothetical protein